MRRPEIAADRLVDGIKRHPVISAFGALWLLGVIAIGFTVVRPCVAERDAIWPTMCTAYGPNNTTTTYQCGAHSCRECVERRWVWQ